MAAGYFLLTKSGNQFKFALKAGNHETILSSERYASKASAQNGIASVKTNSGNDASYERKTSKDDKPYFVLKAANGEIIGTREMYSSTSAARRGTRRRSLAPGVDLEGARLRGSRRRSSAFNSGDSISFE
jgi:uncharacterized protein YegP (UPF0339 family)